MNLEPDIDETDELDDDPEPAPRIRPSIRERATATTATFVQTRRNGPLTLVLEGDPLPPGDQVPAAWDERGRCWHPATPGTKRRR